MFGGIPNSHLYAAQQLECEFTLRDGSSKTKWGTAFFVRSAGVLSLVTNRHMMDLAYSGSRVEHVGALLSRVAIHSYLADGNIEALPNNRITQELHLAGPEVSFAADYDEDVACVVNPLVRRVGGGQPHIDFWVDAAELATEEWIRDQLSVCDFVAFPGFPPWYDRLGNRPILRTGAIASDPRADYSDEPRRKGRRIAVEAFSFGGSSGSPVFATQKGIRTGPGLHMPGFREGKLIGINAGHFTAGPAGHSGVSYLIKSSSILELVPRG